MLRDPLQMRQQCAEVVAHDVFWSMMPEHGIETLILLLRCPVTDVGAQSGYPAAIEWNANARPVRFVRFHDVEVGEPSLHETVNEALVASARTRTDVERTRPAEILEHVLPEDLTIVQMVIGMDHSSSSSSSSSSQSKSSSSSSS